MYFFSMKYQIKLDECYKYSQASTYSNTLMTTHSYTCTCTNSTTSTVSTTSSRIIQDSPYCVHEENVHKPMLCYSDIAIIHTYLITNMHILLNRFCVRWTLTWSLLLQIIFHSSWNTRNFWNARNFWNTVSILSLYFTRQH